MFGIPGERVFTERLSELWGEGDDAQAIATMVAAAHHVCCQLLPLNTWECGVRRYAVALAPEVPAVLEVSVSLPVGRAELSLRVPLEAEKIGHELTGRITDQIRSMVPVTVAVAGKVSYTDDLPF